MSTKVTSQERIDEAEWEDRRNWKLGLFYYSRRDSRPWVPKRTVFGGRQRLGGTPNLAKPEARRFMAITIGIMIVVVLIVAYLDGSGVI